MGPSVRHPNRRRAVEKLVSALEQGVSGGLDDGGVVDSTLIDTSAEPRGRTRTPLTAKEVDAIRTAHAAGANTTVLARQYGVHRATIWQKTRLASEAESSCLPCAQNAGDALT